MEACPSCWRKNLYDFMLCEFCLCKKPTDEPERLNTEVLLDDAKEYLNSGQTENIKANLLRKIHIINSCSSTLISKTQVCLAKIQSMCLQSINTLNIKKQYYLRLLKSTDKYLIPEERQNIKRELSKVLIGCIPTQYFKDINDFYSFDFIKDVQQFRKFSSMKINDFKHILEEEYRLPLAAPFKSGRFLRGHSGAITALAITSDSKHIISGAVDNTVRIWNLEDNSLEAVLHGHTGKISRILVTNDCKYIISASHDKTGRIWSFITKMQVAIVAMNVTYNYSVEITSDSKYIAYCTSDKTLATWNFQTNMQETILQDNTHPISAITVSSNSKYVISGFIDSSIMIWTVDDKILKAVFYGGGRIVIALAITNDNKYLISSFRHKLKVWNLENEQLEDTLDDNNLIYFIKTSQDSKYIYYACWKNELRVWNLQERKLESVMHNDNSQAMILVVNNNTGIAPGFYNQQLIVQRMIGSSKDIILIYTNYLLDALAVTHDGKYIIFPAGSTIEMLNLHSANEKYILSSLRATITSVTLSSDHRFIVFGSGSENNYPILIDNTVRVWDLHEKKEIAVFQGHTNSITALAISRDNKYIVSGSWDTTVGLWNLYENKKEAILQGHNQAITAVAITSEKIYIVSASSDHTLRIWSVEKRISLAVLEGAFNTSKLLITFDSKYIVSNSDNV